MLTDIATHTRGGLTVSDLLDMTLDEIFFIADTFKKRMKVND